MCSLHQLGVGANRTLPVVAVELLHVRDGGVVPKREEDERLVLHPWSGYDG